MIDGLLLLLELGLMLVLLFAVWRAQQGGRDETLGFFAYKDTLKPPPRAPPPPRSGSTRARPPPASPPHPGGGRHHA
jgi:hypothetical protein